MAASRSWGVWLFDFGSFGKQEPHITRALLAPQFPQVRLRKGAPSSVAEPLQQIAD